MLKIKYIIKHLLMMIVTLFIVSVVTFAAFNLIPGDAVTTKLGTNYTQEAAQQLREQYGLDKPAVTRYFEWMSGFVTGDLGTSIARDMEVSTVIEGTFTVSLTLTFLSILITLLLAIPIATYSSLIKNPLLKRLLDIMDHIFLAVPAFFVGIIICVIFGLGLKWFMPGEYISYKQSLTGFLLSILPAAIALAIPKVAMTVKFMKTTMSEQLRLNYVKTSYSIGNSKLKTLWKHVLKNTLVLTTTIIGITLAEALAGSIVVEQVFGLPGVGRILIESIFRNDYMVVQTLVVYIAVFVVLVNFAMDIIYRVIDPRIGAANEK